MREGLGTIVLASTSEGKLREIRDALSGLGVELLSLEEAGWDEIEIPETGETFEENARLKADIVSGVLGCVSLADDSGLECDALAGRPGVHSARFAGRGATDDDRNRELVRLLEGTGEPAPWAARYRCVLALSARGRTIACFEGACEGAIVAEPRGTDGFGYDPHFLLPERGVTVGEIPLVEKQQISHRGRALRALATWLAEKE